MEAFQPDEMRKGKKKGILHRGSYLPHVHAAGLDNGLIFDIVDASRIDHQLSLDA